MLTEGHGEISITIINAFIFWVSSSSSRNVHSEGTLAHTRACAHTYTVMHEKLFHGHVILSWVGNNPHVHVDRAS